MDDRNQFIEIILDELNLLKPKEAQALLDEVEERYYLFWHSVKWSWEEINGLFSAQLCILKRRGCPKDILDILTGKRGDVLAKVSEMGGVLKKNIPFLAVIPPDYMSLYNLMCMIHHDGGGSVDAPRVKPPIQRNMVEKPEEPYFLIDVEDGRANLRKFGDRKVSFGKPRSRIISESIKGQGRFLLTYYEGVALAILSGVLSRHYIRCSGSSCGIPEFGCDLSLNHQGTPTFGYAGEDSPTSPTARWGTPSCCSWI